MIGNELVALVTVGMVALAFVGVWRGIRRRWFSCTIMDLESALRSRQCYDYHIMRIYIALTPKTESVYRQARNLISKLRPSAMFMLAQQNPWTWRLTS